MTTISVLSTKELAAKIAAEQRQKALASEKAHDAQEKAKKALVEKLSHPTGFSDDQQRHAYMAARQIPAVLNQLYCWCHCRESTIFHHRSLLECFESDHASQCSICMGEATLAYDMVKRGVTDVRQIQDAIDSRFGPLARGRT